MTWDDRGPKTSMRDNVVPLGEDHVIFVKEGVRKPANKIEQSITARWDMRAVLDVAFRPEPLRGIVVAFVEQGVKL